MKFLRLLPSLALFAFTFAAAHADPIIVVAPWLAPNAFGSPSYDQAIKNEEYAIEHGLSTYGPPGPTQYNAVTKTITPEQAIVTGFNSWMGQAEPGGANSAELGNRQAFGLYIDGNGTQFSISQLAFTGTETASGALSFSNAAGTYNYSDTNGYIGINFGADHALGGGDDTYITSGSNTQLVDALVGRGSGNSFAAYCTGCSPAAEQAAIEAAVYDSSYTFTGTYSLKTPAGRTIASGSGSFNVAPAATTTTPEPSSLALLGTGALGIVGAIRRKRRSA